MQILYWFFITVMTLAIATIIVLLIFDLISGGN